MNLELFEEVKSKILSEPENFVMSEFHCGTSFCIAGWAVAIDCFKTQKPIPSDVYSDVADDFDWENKAAKLLQIPCGTSESDILEPFDSGRLFYTTEWPRKFIEIHRATIDNPLARAQNACNRIDHFIKTGE